MLAWFPVLWVVGFVNSKELPSSYHHLQGHQVWHVSSGMNDVVQGLEAQGIVDVLDHSRSRRSLRIAPQHQEYVHDLLREHNMDYKIHIEELLGFLQDQNHDARKGRAKESKGGEPQRCTPGSCPKPLTDEYMTVEQMNWYLSEIADHYPDRVNVTSIGKSVEGRDIWLVNVRAGNCMDEQEDGRRRRSFSKKTKTLWIEGGLHAREWISSAVALQLIDRFLNECRILQSNDVYIVPMANPDGYKYTWTTDRMWRKNRAVLSGTSCKGVDLNRNWDYHWGVGASTTPCSEVYQGPSAFSEPETKALRDAMMKMNKTKMRKKKKKVNKFKRTRNIKKRKSQKYNVRSLDLKRTKKKKKHKDKKSNKRRKIKKRGKWKSRNNKVGDIDLVLSLHSYGQVLMYPWGWTADPAPDTVSMKKMGQIFAGAAKERQGSRYEVVNSAGGFYYASGATDDWAKGQLGSKYVYTLELRDDGTHGFHLPEDQILDTGNEVWDGMRRLLTALSED